LQFCCYCSIAARQHFLSYLLFLLFSALTSLLEVGKFRKLNRAVVAANEFQNV
jgi:hypothetical protein